MSHSPTGVICGAICFLDFDAMLELGNAMPENELFLRMYTMAWVNQHDSQSY